MTIGERIEHRRKAIGIKSQSELARMAGVGQSTLNGLIRNPYRSSPYLSKIARQLRTTVDYLMGETDDPDGGAPPPPDPQVVHVMLPVALPAKSAMAAMFEGLLLSLGDWPAMPTAELAQELATLLPTGLGVIRGPLRYEPSADGDAHPAPAEDHATADREPRRARRG